MANNALIDAAVADLESQDVKNFNVTAKKYGVD